MATTDALPAPQERQGHRRRPFSTWVKKLANFKSSSDGDRPRRNGKKKHGSKLNNPYPESGRVGVEHTAEESAASLGTPNTGSHISIEPTNDTTSYHNERRTVGGRSVAGTVSTEHEGSTTAPSHGASSVAGTSRTVGGGVDSRRGGDSTFSSPAPSVRSLTTTLTTIQSSLVPNGAHNGTDALANNNTQSVQFSQPFPTNSPASAIPAHLTPTGMPNTYTAATANGLLTDNASILTLASSSKRRRRRSMDTDASVRALAPSSVWGGSRESLPLSVLSANIESAGPGLQGSGSRLGAERSSIYSAVAGDRNSFYAKQGDAASVRSARPSHVRTDSVTTPGATAQLNSPLVSQLPNDKFDKDDKEEASGSSPKEK